METRLIRFRIRQGQLEQFIEEWKAGVVPLREQFGFTFVGTWSLPETSEVIVVIRHSDNYDTADRAYFESEERKGLVPNPAVHIEEALHTVADTVI